MLACLMDEETDKEKLERLTRERREAMVMTNARQSQSVILPETSDMVSLAQAATPHAMAALLDIAMNGASDSARVAAAVALLDRAHGKPGQSVTVYQGAKEMRAAWSVVEAELVKGEDVEDI